jgi:hypothetical protein
MSNESRLADRAAIAAAAIAAAAGLAAFFGFSETREIYARAYAARPLAVSFIKFAILATGGEMLALRIRTGVYWRKGFGLLPKMLVWGILGLAIYAAFGIFSVGAPALCAPLLSRLKNPTLATAFCISFFMNLFFAPLMMMVHHLTDRFIESKGGRFPLREFRILPLAAQIDWPKMWGKVYKYTIPLFWIPAHTVTFLLPTEFRTLFAAILSVALGLLIQLLGSDPKS